MFFKISKKIESMESKEAAYYIALSYICSEKKISYVDAATLCCYLFGHKNNTALNRDKITRAINKYKNNWKIKKLDNSNVYEVDASMFSSKYYAYLEWDVVVSILRSNIKCKYDLIKYMGLVALSFDKSKVKANPYDVFGYMPNTYFARLMKKTVQSISSYNSKLCELGILYIYHRMNNSNVYSFRCGIGSAKDFAHKSID